MRSDRAYFIIRGPRFRMLLIRISAMRAVRLAGARQNRQNALSQYSGIWPRSVTGMAEQALQPPKKLHYAWIVVGLTFAVMLVSAGMRATSAVMLVPWEAE